MIWSSSKRWTCPALPRCGDLVLVPVHRRDVVPLATPLDHHRVAAEPLQEGRRVVVPLGYVDPEEPVAVGEQLDHVVRGSQMGALGVEEANLHASSVTASAGHGKARSTPRIGGCSSVFGCGLGGSG
jgi:hypothetical protein